MARSTRWLDWSVLILAVVLGAGSVALFAWPGRPLSVPLNLPEPAALAWDASLSCFFFVQHSGMVRRSFRRRLSAIVPLRYDGAVYAIASGIALLAVVVFWQPTGNRILTLEGFARWIAAGCAMLAAAVFAHTIYVLRPFDPLGIRSIWANLHGRVSRPSSFVARGAYRWVRHPLYSCIIVLLWAEPDLTSDRLLLNVLWTAWIWLGATLEERDLAAEFGEGYGSYQRQVPMLVPWRGRVDVVPGA